MANRQFLYVDADGNYTEAYAEGNTIERSCDSSLAVGDLVMESETIANGVDKVTDNQSTRSVIGYCVEKPDATTALIMTKGIIEGVSGLTKAAKVYLSSSGTPTPQIPVSGYLQVLGHAIDSDKFDFDPINTKIKIYKAPMTFPLTLDEYIYPDQYGNAQKYFGIYMKKSSNYLVIGQSTTLSSGHAGVNLYEISGTSLNLIHYFDVYDSQDDYLKLAGADVNNTGDTVALAYRLNNNPGKVLVYNFDGSNWNETVIETSDDLWDVELNDTGDLLIVTKDGSSTASAYKYDGSSWASFTSISLSNSSSQPVIQMLDNKLMIYVSNNREINLFDYTGADIVADDVITHGSSATRHPVLLDTNTVIAGDSTADGNATNDGKVTIYYNDGTGWALRDTLYSPYAQDDEYFGTETIGEGNLIAVYSGGHDTNETDDGLWTIYKYDEDNAVWVEQQQITPPAGETFDDPGYALQYITGLFYNDGLLLGSMKNDDMSSDAGAVFNYI